MPLITPEKTSKKKKISIHIKEDILEQINQYCAWQKIDKIDQFVEAAVLYIFSKDKDWNQHLKSENKKIKK